MSTLNITRKKSEGIYKEKGSKFMAYLFPVVNDEDVKANLEGLREEHNKARHHCYAFRFGSQGENERANDDGEPNGSAGLPILNQLYSANLTNTLIVVVRYFGGTKLGLSGLIHAYKEASKDAISNTSIKQYIAMTTLELRFTISVLGEVEKIIRREKLDLIESDFGENCLFRLSIKKENFERLESLLSGVQGLSLKEI